MKSLFDPTLVEDTKERILRLRPESERQWGTMAVAQMLMYKHLDHHLRQFGN